MSGQASGLKSQATTAQEVLDAWVREVIEWHFDFETGSPYWLDWAAKAGWDPRAEVYSFTDLVKFGHLKTSVFGEGRCALGLGRRPMRKKGSTCLRPVGQVVFLRAASPLRTFERITSYFHRRYQMSIFRKGRTG